MSKGRFIYDVDDIATAQLGVFPIFSPIKMKCIDVLIPHLNSFLFYPEN